MISLLDSCSPGVWRRLHVAACSAAASTEKTLLHVSLSFLCCDACIGVGVGTCNCVCVYVSAAREFEFVVL